MITALTADIRYASRLFARNPGFVAIAVLSIAFGTGANVAIFSATDALLLRPLPVDDPRGLLTVGTDLNQGRDVRIAASYQDFLDISQGTRTLERFSALVSMPAGMRRGNETARVRVVTTVNAEFFDALRVPAAIGRTFHPRDDDLPGGNAVAVLSHGIWQRDFGGDTGVVGRIVQLADREFTVIGVLPETFTGMQPRYVRDSVYVPISMLAAFVQTGDRVPVIADAPGSGNPLRDRAMRLLTVRARLRPGTSLRQANADIERLSADLARAYPQTNTGTAFTLRTELQAKFAEETFDTGAIIILSTLSIAVLAVACANVAGLLASRATARGREIALRMAIGAGRVRIVRQLVVESLVLAMMGGAMGIGVGYLGVLVLQQLRMPTEVFAYPEFRLDERALVFSLVAAVASAFLFGLAPAIQTARVDLIAILKSAETGAPKQKRLTARGILVSTQVALSLMLLTVAVWAFENYRQHLGQGPGFRIERSVKATLDAGPGASPGALVQYFERAADAARREPGVTAATIMSAMPLFSFSPGAFVPEGFQLPPGEAAVSTMVNSIDEHYFRTMEIPIVAGRGFRSDDDLDSANVAIVNEIVAGRFWPSGAVGRRLRLNHAAGPLVEVVGVARTAKYGYFVEPPQSMIYFPFRQRPRTPMVLVAATSGPSAASLLPLVSALSRVDAAIPVQDAQTLEDFYTARARSFGLLTIRLVGGMGVMGVILASIGLYGLVSYATSRRTREIGIRIAIGATPRRIVAMVLHQGMMPAWYGLAVGAALSVLATNLLPQALPLAFDYANDLRLFAIVGTALLAVALLAAFIPARRGAAVDPTVALRHD